MFCSLWKFSLVCTLSNIHHSKAPPYAGTHTWQYWWSITRAWVSPQGEGGAGHCSVDGQGTRPYPGPEILCVGPALMSSFLILSLVENPTHVPLHVHPLLPSFFAHGSWPPNTNRRVLALILWHVFMSPAKGLKKSKTNRGKVCASTFYKPHTECLFNPSLAHLFSNVKTTSMKA